MGCKGLLGMKDNMLRIFHWVKYGGIEKYTPDIRKGPSEGILINNAREEKEFSKERFENALLKRNIRRWDKGDFNTYGLPVHETSVSEINIAIIEWFKKKWLRDESEEKIQFYLWLEDNYFQGLLGSERNKKRHFKDTYRQYRYSTKIKSINKIWQCILELSAIGITLLIPGIITQIKSGIELYFNSVPRWIIAMSFVVSVIILAVTLLYWFRLVFQAEYRKYISKVDKTKETWVRHIEVVAGYQKELLDYLWDSGEYRKWKCQKDRDTILIERIMSVWENNLGRFRHNMKKADDDSS